MQMRETARASMLTLPNHGVRGTDYSKGDLSDYQKTATDDRSSEFDDGMQGRPF